MDACNMKVLYRSLLTGTRVIFNLYRTVVLNRERCEVAVCKFGDVCI